MKKITETLIGSLASSAPDDRLAFLISRINETIKPPREASSDNVNIRAMYVVNDRVNSHGGRFQREDLLSLCRRICDTPVLVGHNRASEPLARTFHAELEEKDGALWLKSYFYWPKSEGVVGAAKASSLDEFLTKIDSGIFKECSISFTYTFPQCSVCGEDIRTCPHEVELSAPSFEKPHFIYRGITQVLETSLVYKGSVRGTHITDRLIMADEAIVVRSGARQISIPIPRLMGSTQTAIIPLENTHDECRVVSAPAGALAAVAHKDGKRFVMFKHA